MNMTDQLREIIRDYGVTHSQLAVQAGVAESVICRFMNGESGLTLIVIDRIADLLQIKLSSRVKLTRPKGPRRPKEG